MQKESKLYLGDCLDVLPTLEADTIDAIVTDPPYGLKFMNNKWDASVPSVEIWQECLRVLKPGAFAFVMSSPRQDVLSRMIVNLTDAGFNTSFSGIYWTYNTGVPKASSISKQIDKRAGAEREVIGKKKWATSINPFVPNAGHIERIHLNDTAPATPQAKTLDGAYSGCQLKPAVEIIIVAMKPLSEKTYTDQALKNGHGCTWLDNCKMPYESDAEIGVIESKMAKKVKMGTPRKKFLNGSFKKTLWKFEKRNGRFPANVLCQDNVLDNSDSFSRYFSLDAWFAERIKLLPKEAQKTFPWLIVPKPSKNEKNKNLLTKPELSYRPTGVAYNEYSSIHSKREKGNIHTTIKPLKLMMWLIILASREGDVILDTFMGSGTTPLAAKMVHRAYKGIELKEEFFNTAVKRVDKAQQSMDRFL